MIYTHNLIYVSKLLIEPKNNQRKQAYKILEGKMEESYRNNIIEFSKIYLGKTFEETHQNEFKQQEFTQFIFKQLFNIDLNQTGYGLDNSTKQMTNNIGDLKIYNKNDVKKINYIDDIKKGDLVFFHKQSLEENSPSPANKYPGHVGIYLGDKKFIHVSDEEKITIDKIDEEPWLNILVASRDIIKTITKNYA